MESINKEILEYCIKHTSVESDVLKQIERNTHLYLLQPRMLSGHFQGKFLEFISKMIAPKRILEIGTYSGYSAVCLASGLSEDGKLYTIEINPELEYLIKKHISIANLQDKIVLLIGAALEIIPEINDEFDLVFIDADKENYLTYFNLVFPKLRKGGYIISDNVLWDSKVLNTKVNCDIETLKIDEFNKSMINNQNIEVIILPIRDGLSLIRKI